MGSYCAAILEGGDNSHSSSVEIDSTTISAMPLGILREMCTDLAEKKPNDWQKSITRVQAEIKRRYRT